MLFNNDEKEIKNLVLPREIMLLVFLDFCCCESFKLNDEWNRAYLAFQYKQYSTAEI